MKNAGGRKQGGGGGEQHRSASSCKAETHDWEQTATINPVNSWSMPSGGFLVMKISEALSSSTPGHFRDEAARTTEQEGEEKETGGKKKKGGGGGGNRRAKVNKGKGGAT